MTKVAVAGSFDHLHQGHRSLLSRAFSLPREVVVGITSHDMTTHKAFANSIESLDKRMASLTSACETFGKSYEIVVLDDAIGPSLEAEFSDIVVTSLTRAGAELINSRRSELEMPLLTIHEVPLVLCADAIPLSSTRIRAGEVDREGMIYKKLFSSPVNIDDNTKQLLKQPMGELSRSLERHGNPWIVVGDATYQKVTEAGLKPHLSILDGHVGRQVKKEQGGGVAATLSNPAGSIQPSVVDAIEAQLVSGGILTVQGEEDLLTLPAVLLAPLGAEVWYGQPDEGIVKIMVDEAIKTKAVSIVRNQANQ